MLLLQTAQNACEIYRTWVVFLQYTGIEVQAEVVLNGDGRASSIIMDSAKTLLGILRLAIADSIMVSLGPW
jgi:hypothetical protein